MEKLTLFTFSCVSNLFSKDISENFIILSTFANKDTMKNGPANIESIIMNADFLKIEKKMGEKWWFAFDSKCVLDNDEDKLTKYSFSQ